MNKYIWRALGVGFATFITALLVYDRPPELALYWQPLLLGIQAALVQAGINAKTRNHAGTNTPGNPE